MEVVLYKMTVFAGKEDMTKEWLAFLAEHKEVAAEILKDEKAYYESYF